MDANHTLTFADLKKWLEEKDQDVDIKHQDVKGKRKAQSPTKSKKKRHDERDSVVVQRKHKKSKTVKQSDGESE